MTVSPQGMSVQSLYRYYRDGSLVINRQYQRKLVWTIAEKQKLIDSILHDYPLPLFLFAEKPLKEGRTCLEVIDGMQRLNAIFSYIEHGFKWEEKCFNVDEFTRARQAADAGYFEIYEDNVERLPAQQCANILDYQLAVTVFPGEKDERITDVFGRINSGGKQLSDQERRQAGVLSPFAELVRSLSAEIRGDVSRDTLALSEMPEISIETGRNPHGYGLKAEDIFWCYQGVLRTGDLRDSEDEQVLADICASILHEAPVEASGDFLDRIYTKDCPEYEDINKKLTVYGRERLTLEVKTIFSCIRLALENYDPARFTFRTLVYPKATSNAQKAPFYSLFMAFHDLMYKEGLSPPHDAGFMKAINNLTERIKVGQKHIKGEDRLDNIRITGGLIRNHFTKIDKAAFAHGPGLIFDFENSIRRSKTETSRYEFKQGLLRLDQERKLDKELLPVLIETICGIANVGADADGYLYLGIADKPADAKRVEQLDGVAPVYVPGVPEIAIVGIDRELKASGLSFDNYMRVIVDAISASALTDPLKTNVLGGIDVVDYRGRSVVRITIPKQNQVSFVGDDCFFRKTAGTHKATGPQIAAITAVFAKK